MNTMLITNGKLVTPDRVIDNGELLIEQGIIKHIGSCSSHIGKVADTVIDADGGYIMPGFIDTHSDAIEKELEPRPGAYFDINLAFCELEKKLAGQGITTIYHSFSFANAIKGARNDQTAAEYIHQIKALTDDCSLIRNKIHLRFEISNFKAVGLIKNLINDGAVDLLSFMDHTPGQGQYPTVESYRRYAEKTYNLKDSGDIEQIIKRKQKGKLKADKCIEEISAMAQQNELSLASHDDDTAEKIEYYYNKGVRLSEFPINLETAADAKQRGMFVSVGAPNIVRGGSTGHGMRAVDAVNSGCANVLCSDYYPPSMLHAVFCLADKQLSMAEAAAMATSEPAKALNLQQLGSLEEGKSGDVIVVKKRHETPVVTSTIVDGMLVYDMNYRMLSTVGNCRKSVC